MESSTAKRRRAGSRRRGRSAIIASAAALMLSGGMALAATPAFAGTGDCPSGYLCTWADADFQTNSKGASLIKFQYFIPNYGSWTYSGTKLNGANSATSIYNNGKRETAYMYKNVNKSGLLFSIPRGNSNNNLWWQGEQNDNIESGYYASNN